MLDFINLPRANWYVFDIVKFTIEKLNYKCTIKTVQLFYQIKNRTPLIAIKTITLQ